MNKSADANDKQQRTITNIVACTLKQISIESGPKTEVAHKVAVAKQTTTILQPLLHNTLTKLPKVAFKLTRAIEQHYFQPYAANTFITDTWLLDEPSGKQTNFHIHAWNKCKSTLGQYLVMLSNDLR